MSLKDLFHTVANYLPWREESQLINFRSAVDEEFADPQPEPSPFVTEPGAQNPDGSPFTNG